MPRVLTGRAGGGPSQITNGAAFAQVNPDGTITLSPLTGVFPFIPKSGRSVGAIAAVASVVTLTPTVDSSFRIWANVLVTTATLYSFQVTCVYTDEGNTSRTDNLDFLWPNSTLLHNTLVNTDGVTVYSSVIVPIRAKANTSITIATSAGGTYTTVAYNVEGFIEQVS
jgi:hypothetical protein